MVKNLTIWQGEYFVGNKDYVVNTLLGSCVSIILWHPVKKIGSMSHCLNPTRLKENNSPLDAKYCDEAIDIMLNKLKFMGVNTQECQAKIFGGASMSEGYKNVQTGIRNVEFTIRQLRKYNIPIVGQDTLGNKHRKIIFYVESGKVLCG